MIKKISFKGFPGFKGIFFLVFKVSDGGLSEGRWFLPKKREKKVKKAKNKVERGRLF